MADVSAFGAALLAGLEAGIWSDLEQLPGLLPQARKIEPGEEYYAEINAAYDHWNVLVLNGNC